MRRTGQFLLGVPAQNEAATPDLATAFDVAPARRAAASWIDRARDEAARARRHLDP